MIAAEGSELSFEVCEIAPILTLRIQSLVRDLLLQATTTLFVRSHIRIFWG